MEDILINELSYESKRVLDSFANVYQYICTRVNVFAVIESFHLANLSGVKILERLVRDSFQGRLRLIAAYNESYHVPEYIEPSWRVFWMK